MILFNYIDIIFLAVAGILAAKFVKKKIPKIIIILLIVIGSMLSINKDIIKTKEIAILNEKVTEVSPRDLSKLQIQQLTSELSNLEDNNTTVGFISRLQDGESFDYASQLNEIFKNAGFNVIQEINRTFLDDLKDSLTISATNENLFPVVISICDSLNSVNMDCAIEKVREGSIGGKLEENTVYIIVGRKK